MGSDRKEYNKEYYQEHKDIILNRTKEWYQNNKERGKQINLKANKKIKLLVLQHYGGKIPNCACCNEMEQGFLTIDHTNNNGAEHRKEIKRGGGVAFYYWLKLNNFPKGYQVLCFNCNLAKALYGKCPHKN